MLIDENQSFEEVIDGGVRHTIDSGWFVSRARPTCKQREHVLQKAVKSTCSCKHDNDDF